MNRKLRAALGMALALLGLATASVLPSGAQGAPPPIALEPLTPRSTFTDDVDLGIRVKYDGRSTSVIRSKAPSRTVVARITVQPGAQFPWHTHPGPVIVNVAQGELVYVQASDCIERSYPMGTAFVDPGRGNVHTAFNPTDGETVLIATFFEIPEAGPLTITEGIVPPADCQV
jgi:quercetin dioxygenase-like cupin family protein